MVALRHAARDLQIDMAIGDAVARDEFAQNHFERQRADRQGEAQFRCRTGEPFEMPRLIEKFSGENLDDLVNAVGKEEGAVIDRHRRLGVANIAAVDIGDAGHCHSFFRAALRAAPLA